VTINNNTRAFTRLGNWNEYNLNPLTRNNWRASLVPAAAVIPAPIAYIKVVAVKKLVVGFLARRFARRVKRVTALRPVAIRAGTASSFTGRHGNHGLL
jgi:hypothetical protein